MEQLYDKISYTTIFGFSKWFDFTDVDPLKICNKYIYFPMVSFVFSLIGIPQFICLLLTTLTFMKFNFFKAALPVNPAFDVLKKSPLKDLYFYRAAPWYWLSVDVITVIDNHAPRMITMDPWPQMIFLDATGKLTTGEYVDFVASKYKKEIPADLDTIILSMIELLLKDKVICLSETPKEPAAEYNHPRYQ